jgi:myosin heavy subunit
MLEAIRIRKQGFAIRMQMEDFIDRYRLVFGPKAKTALPQELTLKQKCDKILK